MRYKILIGVLVIAIIILSGLTYRYYSMGLSKQALINDMRGQAIVAWAHQMDMAAYYLKYTTTNHDMYVVTSLLRSISGTPLIAWLSDEQTLYHRMYSAAYMIDENLAPFAVGNLTVPKQISPIAISMIKDLAQKIWNTISLIIGGPTAPDLTHLNGEDPIKLLEEKGILNPIINSCVDIIDYSGQIYNIEPKFQ